MKEIINMKHILLIFNLLIFINSFSQTRDEILAEAYLLYNSEKASWNGTDIFLEKFPNKMNQIGGYLSYTENEEHSCVFFDQSEDPNLMAKITFNNEFEVESAKIDTIKRKLNHKEKDLFTIRQIALKEVNQDTIFKTYNNTNLNVIPLASENEKKVFILTGPQISGVVVLGNDYLLKFNKENKLIEKKSLHKNIIPLDYNEKTKDAVTIHNHLESTSDYITSTDICTFLLYKEHINWRQHIVISKNNVSLWSFDNNNLILLTKKSWEKIYKSIGEKED